MLGLRHASTPAEEYGDFSTPMGHCARCMYSAPHLLQLGWATPLATLVRETLPAATDARFTLPALGKAKGSALVIVPDWPLPAFGSSLSAAWYEVVISYRVKGGQDEDIESPFSGAASVHFVARGAESNPVYVGCATVGRPFVDSDTGLVVRVPVMGDANGLKVVVCRFANSPSQCKA
jgi:hypothetical protein